jgi:heat shock protein HslJ
LALDGEPPSDGGTTPMLVIREDGAVAGSSGINRFMTRVVPDDLAAGRLAFAATAGTKMAGPPQAMELERTFLDRLEAVSTFAVEGDILRLFAGDTEVLVFERATP